MLSFLTKVRLAFSLVAIVFSFHIQASFEAGPSSNQQSVCLLDQGYHYFSKKIRNIKHLNAAQFTLAVDRANRKVLSEPIERLSNQHRLILFYTNLRDLANTTVVHRWIYEDPNLNRDRIMAEVPFRIKGVRWRVWSSKNLWPTWTGRWRVEVLNQKTGVVYHSASFEYVLAKQFEKEC